MPIESQHPDHLIMQSRWDRCRDVSTGQDSVKAGEELYLPRPSGMTDDDYKNYVSRAVFFNATQRTQDAMLGLIFRKDPQLDYPESAEDLVNETTMDGRSLAELSMDTVEEILEVGRFGVLVDFPQVDDPDQVTVAQAEADGSRPYLATYAGETIINWRFRNTGAGRVLDMVVLAEQYQYDNADEYLVEERIRYRELRLDELGRYYQVVHLPEGEEGALIAQEPTIPMMGGNPLTFIPFFCATVAGDDVEIRKPPLIDLVDLNLAHYRNSADYEHGLHFAGNPMPVITGWDGDDGSQAIVVGSERALVLDDPQAKAFYMEFTGAGLSTLETSMQTKQRLMAAIGTRLLHEDTRGVEAAETAAIHRAGENSILGKIAESASKVLTRSLQLLLEWNGTPDESASVQLNTDYLPFALDAPSVTALMGLWQEGVISKQTLFQKLQEGEAIPPGVDFNIDQVLVDQEGMDFSTTPVPPPPADE